MQKNRLIFRIKNLTSFQAETQIMISAPLSLVENLRNAQSLPGQKLADGRMCTGADLQRIRDTLLEESLLQNPDFRGSEVQTQNKQ